MMAGLGGKDPLSNVTFHVLDLSMRNRLYHRDLEVIEYDEEGDWVS